MPTYVADTHALWWYLSGDARLSPTAHAVFDEAVSGGTTIRVPAIAIAELILLMEKRRAVVDAAAILAKLPRPAFS